MFDWIRASGWDKAELKDYREACERFGGSVATHPDFVDKISVLLDAPVKYWVNVQQGEILGALATWGKYLACSQQYQKEHNKLDIIEFASRPEIILPLHPEKTFSFGFKGRHLSELHAKQIHGLKPGKKDHALIKGYGENGMSNKSQRDFRRTVRLFKEAGGGEVLPISSLNSHDMAGIYIDLLSRRWNRKIPLQQQQFGVALKELEKFLIGDYLLFDGKPVAISLVFRAESPSWIAVEDVNSGVDPDKSELSPGNVLNYLNTCSQYQYGLEMQKTLRYSFRAMNREYKAIWCRSYPSYRTA